MKKICSLLLALVLIFTLAACANSNNAADDKNNTNEDSNPSTPSTPNTPDDSSDDGNNEGSARTVVNVGIDGDITNFFPWQSRGSGGWEAAIGGLYQTLLTYYPADDTYYPCLAKSVTMADDGLSMDIELFDYIHDSEGHAVTVDDAIFSFNKTYETFSDVRDMAKEAVKTGDNSFTIVFNRPLRLGEYLYLTNWSIVSQEAFENSPDEMQLTPVGTGPYKLTAHEEGSSFTYEKVQDYWQTDPNYDNPRDRANIDTINWYVISESAQRTIALEQHTIDICSSVSSADLEKFDGQNGYHLYSYSAVLNMTLFPNCDPSKLTSDVNLRLAICYAINTQGILDGVYGGIGSVMHDAGPSWSVNYNPDWDNEDNYYNYSLEKSAEYLAKSNYNGEELLILAQSDEASSNTAQLIQVMLAQANINAKPLVLEFSTFSDYAKDPSQWDLMVKTNPTGNSNYLSAVESPMNPEMYTWGGSVNFVYDDEFAEILDASLQGDATADDVEALHRCLIDNCYIMGLVNLTTNVVVPDDLTDVVLSTRNTIMPGASSYE